MARLRHWKGYRHETACLRMERVGVIERIGRKLLTADVMIGALILLGLQVTVYGISESLRIANTASFFWLCLVAATMGFWPGRFRWNGFLASGVNILVALLVIWVLGARLAQPLMNLGKEILSIFPQWSHVLRDKETIDSSTVVDAWQVITDATFELIVRLRTWLGGVEGNRTGGDELIISLFWVLALWLCSAWMGWFTERRNAMMAFLPFLIVLALVTSYSEYKMETIWMMIIIIPVLLGVWNYRNHIRQWEESGIDYSDSVLFDSGQAILFITLLIGSLAVVAPPIAWQDIVDYLRERQSNETAHMLGIQEPKGSQNPITFQYPALPRVHLLTGGYANSEKIVMRIRTNELPPTFDPSLSGNAPRYYWRSAIYDRYEGTGWITTAFTTQTIPPGTPLVPGLLAGYRILKLDVQMVEPEGRLFWSGILFSADIPFTANWRVNPTIDIFADQMVLLQADMFAASSASASYRADAYIPTPTIEELRSASTDYPDGIRGRYLGLPGSVPERVHTLAREITNGITNPYDKARAIETYLRANYPYDLEVPAPPAGRDVADYFLFDLKKGYCDYYATTMVVLARASGLPARFVSGYSPGTYDGQSAEYIVRELNAHSWVEIYFPGIGWIEFEPTASIPEIEHKEGLIPQNQAEDEAAVNLIARFRAEKLFLWASPILGLIFLAVLYFSILERIMYLRLSPEAAIEQIYRKFYPAGRSLAGSWIPAETSTEYLNKLLRKVAEVRKGSRFEGLLSDLAGNALKLTELYHSSLFLPLHVRRKDANLAWRIWRRLRLQLFVARLIMLTANHA